MLTARIYKTIEQRQTRKISAFLSESQYWAPERMRDYQFEKIKKILTHAYQNVPYYRKVFADLGSTPEDIRTKADFARLPVLTKDIIRSNSRDLIASNFKRSGLKPNSTGGSTGEPLHFFQDCQFGAWADAARVRGWYQLAGCNYWDTCAVLWGAMHEVKEDFSFCERVRDYIKIGEIWLNAFNLSDERKTEFFKLCRIVRPRLIRGYFTAIRDFAEFLRENKFIFPPVKGVILCAETVDDASRDEIEKTFQAPAYNTYGGRELSLIAMECQHKNGMHEISENNYVEFEPIELQGYPDAGNLLITNLNNFAMPFIRYRIGDIGVPGEGGVCKCGRGLPRIQKVIGRTTEVLTFSGGLKIAGEMFIHLMKDFPVREYQFVQKSENLVILRYTKETTLDAALRQKITDTYRGYLPPGTKLDFEEIETIHKTPTGKFRFVLRENPIS